MKIYILFILGAFILSFSMSAYAKVPEVSGASKSSGCGLGWEVTKSQTISGSSTRSTTNATASNTIAMTMGTSGCEKHAIVKVDRNVNYYAEANHENIINDFARGGGEYSDHLAQLLNCKDKNAFNSELQRGLNGIVGVSSDQLLDSVIDVVKNDKALRSSCVI